MARRLSSEADAPRHPLVAAATGDDEPLLLVDDRPENLHALEAVLAPLGLPIETAGSGAEALRQVLDRDFSVILLDVRMPGLDGLQTAELIQQRERSLNIPLRFVTAAEREVADLIRGYEAGAVDYVMKPYEPDLLRSKVALFVELGRSRRALERSEALLRASFEFAPLGKTVLDSSLRIVRANAAFGRLLGRDPAELEGLNVAEVCLAEHRGRLCGALRAIQSDEPSPADPDAGGLDVRLEVGRAEVWVAAVASAVQSSELAEPLLLAQWVDLSARRRGEQVRAELLLEQSARSHAERMANRLRTLQALTDALSGLQLQPMLAELAARISALVGAEHAEVVLNGGAAAAVKGAVSVAPTDATPSGSDGGSERVPILFEGRALGMIVVDLGGHRSLDPAERSLLRDAADRAGLAIRQAQLHEADHQIAVELQRGLLPKHVPELPGVTLAARYEAAGARAQVGGDWYDLLALSDQRLGIVVGDVTGSGIAAASAMGQLRSVTRAYALADDGHSPGKVVSQLNWYQFALDSEPSMFTVLYAVLDRAALTLTWTSAGHLPPLLRAATGSVRYLGEASIPIGVDRTDYGSSVESLGIGSSLVIYTDGLVERRGETLDEGLERLASSFRDAPHEPQAACEHLLDRLVPHPEHLDDDMTVVVARVD
ncbi:MAG: SpoIIE family protein phosphatase [Solirubrobacteraceae bacterium]